VPIAEFERAIATIDELSRENDRLIAEREALRLQHDLALQVHNVMAINSDRLRNDFGAALRVWGEQIKFSTEERDRLRAALGRIDSLPDYAPVQSAQDIARNALAKVGQ